jgi:hypothetical protein
MHHLCGLYEENIDLAVLDEAKALPSELPQEGSCGFSNYGYRFPKDIRAQEITLCPQSVMRAIDPSE